MPNSYSRFTPDRLQDYSESEIIKEIRRVIVDECGGVVPSRDRFVRLARVSYPVIVKRFGAYKKAIQQAGFTVHKHASHAKFTKEQVKANLVEVLERANGYYFTQDFYRKNGGAYCEEVVKVRFGVRNWQSVLEAIGAKRKPRIVHTVISTYAQRRNFLADLTEADLFKEINRVWRAKERRPSCSEFIQASHYGISIYETRFGSWPKAIEAFCNTKNIRIQGLPRGRPTKNILLEELRSVQLKHPGAILTFESYKSNGGTYCVSPFRAQFGSWTNAVNAVGSISGEQARYSKDELFDEIQRLWEQFGKQPTQVQMWKQGKISPKCYAKMFGNWTKAVYAFCADRNGDSSPIAIPKLPSSDKNIIERVTSGAPVDVLIKEALPRVIKHGTGRTVSLGLRFKVLKRDSFTCKRCKRSPATHPGLELEVDHNAAYSNGGETMLANLQTLCRECNRRKSNR